MDDMGILYITCSVENPLRRGDVWQLADVLVDTGSELSWFPAPFLEALGITREKHERRFTMADGGTLVRSVGFAIVHAAGEFTIDEVVFGEPGDLTLLGARTIEGMNLRVDLQEKKLVAAGPILAAAAA
jgi:predicted aspartyl protease